MPVARDPLFQASLVVALNSSGIYLGMSIDTMIGSQAIGQGAAVLLWHGAGLAGLSLLYLLMTVSRAQVVVKYWKERSQRWKRDS